MAFVNSIFTVFYTLSHLITLYHFKAVCMENLYKSVLASISSCDTERRFHHRYHQYKEYQQIEWHHPKSDPVTQKSEERRYKGGSDIGAGHLDSDDRARILRAKIIGCGMDDAGVDRRTPTSDRQKGRNCRRIGISGDEHQ